MTDTANVAGWRSNGGPVGYNLNPAPHITWTRGARQDDDPPPAGVREPRRPSGVPPSDAVALSEPR